MTISSYRWAIAVLTGLTFLLAALWITSLVIPSYERKIHNSSLRLSGELLAKGETQRVQQAISTYTNVAATSTTYRAAMKMWDVLSHGPKK
jgi:hypothetical protein